MDRFARLFTLQFQLGESDPRIGDPATRKPRLGKEEQWRVIDRTIVMFGPPAIVNHDWALGMLDLPCTEEETQVELLD
ncbi:MAG: hypothetical protein HQL99_13385 [Magnetococcales bacterium]|nr:hypothetical protein [Magnetococcales bacterium]